MLASTCARAYRSNSVLTASPGRLVLMLYDGALKALGLAREAFARPETDAARLETIHKQLMKAQEILRELQNGLNHQSGGDVARTLDSLYDYHCRRLFEANLRKEVEPVIEVERLLHELREAWAEMLARQDSPTETVRSVG